MDDVKIISTPITKEELETIAEKRFGELVKAVVDLEKQIMAIGGDLHADEEKVLLESGSKQEDLWGVNIYPAQPRETWLEFDSMINLRPSQGNRSREVEDQTRQEQIQVIVNKLIAP